LEHFSKETLAFLRDVAKHNDRAWFAENKPRYEEHVKEPAERFAAEVALKLGMEPHVMRIYRDTRFSKDKSPYKTNVGVGFHKGAGRVTEGAPGYYLHVEPGASFAACGMWQPDPPALAAIREAIVAKPAAWAKARKVGLSGDGEALKKAPRGFDPEHEHVEDLKRRSFTASVGLADAQVASPGFARTYVAAARKLAPLGAFLADAVGAPW
jgi:uncharacterized protein (TIGR02453 family)